MFLSFQIVFSGIGLYLHAVSARNSHYQGGEEEEPKEMDEEVELQAKETLEGVDTVRTVVEDGKTVRTVRTVETLQIPDAETWENMDEDARNRHLKQMPTPDPKTYRQFHKWMMMAGSKLSSNEKSKEFWETYSKNVNMNMKKGQTTGKRVRL